MKPTTKNNNKKVLKKSTREEAIGKNKLKKNKKALLKNIENKIENKIGKKIDSKKKSDKTFGTIFLGSDHAGFMCKEYVKTILDSLKISYVDIGGFSSKNEDDYPTYAKAVGEAVIENKRKNAKGILICGTGTGMVIAANKLPGIRAVAANDEYSAKMSRKDNDANILALRGKNFDVKLIKKILLIWLNTPFTRLTRHKRRIAKIKDMETMKILKKNIMVHLNDEFKETKKIKRMRCVNNGCNNPYSF